MGTQQMMDSGYSPTPGNVMLSNVNYIAPGLEGYYKEPFTYNIFFANAVLNVTQSGTANIQNDSFFVCTQQMVEIWDAATGNTTNLAPTAAAMLVNIKDSSSGKYQMDQAMPLANTFGTALQPKVWLYRSRIYMPGGQLTLELTNQMAAAQRVRFSFEGFKVYKVPDEMASM